MSLIRRTKQFLSKFPSALFARSLEAAGSGRRWSGAKAVSNWNAAIQSGNIPTRQRVRFYVLNNPWLNRAVDTLVINIVGAGIKPQSLHPAEATRQALHRQWNLWTDHADAAGTTDFYGLLALVARALVTDGEIFVWMRQQGRRGFELVLISADQVDASINRELAGGARIAAGIEFDTAGRRAGYHVMRQAPGEAWSLSLDTVRLPAADVLHVFAPISPGQVRGLSWAAPVLLRLHEIDQIEDAGLMRQKVAAMFAGFIHDPNSSAGDFDGKQTGSVLEGGLEPGVLKVLPNGADIRFSEPAQVGDMIDFLKLQLRAVAAGMGVTYEQMTGDLSGVNYSSIRAGLLEFRRRIESIQHNVLVFQLCRPVWERFVMTAALTGIIPTADFFARRDDYLAVKWITPRVDWVDPLKDAQAEITAIGAGLMSRREAVAARGYDVEALDAEIAADVARAKRLGLTFTAGIKAKPAENDNGLAEEPNPESEESSEPAAGDGTRSAPAEKTAGANVIRPLPAELGMDAIGALLVRRLPVTTPSSVDEKTRTARLTWSTGAPVQRFGFVEVLSMSSGAVDLSRLIGAPFLNAHRQQSILDQLGVVIDAGIADGVGWAVVKVSDRPDVEPIWRDIVAGILRNVSVGYSVQAWHESHDPTSGEIIRTATAWTPQEISIVPIAADPGASIRQKEVTNGD